MASRAHNTLSVLPIIIFFLTISLSTFSSNGSRGGFTVELIHRDSPKSPLYTVETTPFQHVHDAVRRSMQRANHFFPQARDDHSLNEVVESHVVSAKGEYVMSYSVGTPPFQIFGIADTGSDLVWTQCQPCQDCYHQTAPMFDPKNSQTFQNIPCSSPQCNSVGKTPCDASNHCKYDAHYADTSSSNGDVVIDKLTLDSTSGRQVAFPKTVFGCGFSSKGQFNEKTSGIVGLGRGSVSLVSQIGSSIDGKFSYCLVPISSLKVSSKLSFGQNAVVSGPGTVSTALVDGHTPSHYFLTLEGISVGDKRFDVSPGLLPVADGNIIIDSGTTVTLLPQLLYSNMESEVASQMTLERVRIPQNLLNLCYKLPSDKSFAAPTITIHFKNANLKLNTYNTFALVSEGVACFAFKAYSSGSIFGNLAQANFEVGYDLQKKMVSFKPMDCTTMT